MIFVTHLLIGAVIDRIKRGPIGWALIGSALPDLIDKPLAMAGVFDVYHSIGHSFISVICLGSIVVVAKYGRLIFLGWSSHIALDLFQIAINGRFTDLLFIFWPWLQSPSPLALPPGAFVFYYLGSPGFFLEIVLWVGIVTKWAQTRLL